MFREPSLWERTKWAWITSLLIIAVLSLITIYLQRSRKQLTLAKEKQMQLSGHADQRRGEGTKPGGIRTPR